MRLSWFAELFGKKKPAVASAAPTGGTSRLRAEISRGDAGSASRPGAHGAQTSRLPRPLGSTEGDPAGRAAGVTTPTLSPAFPQGGAGSGGEASALLSAPLPAPVSAPRARDEEVAKATRMAPQEELSLKVNEGLRNLTTLLQSIDGKMGQQHRATELVAERLQALPRVLEGLVEAERANIETLRDLRGAMEKQGQASLAATEKLTELPAIVDGIGTRIDKQSEASAAVKTSVESVGQSVRGLVDGAQRAQTSLITEFRRGQEEARQRLEEIVERQRKAVMTVAIIGGAVVVVLFIVLARLPG